MIPLLIIGGIAFLLFRGQGLAIPVTQSPVINNATGGSLSSALGSATQPPANYASGVPGYYSSIPTPPPVLAGTSAVKSSVPVQFAQQPQPLKPSQLSGTQAHNNVVYARPVIANTRAQAPIVAPSRVRVLNPATQTIVTVNPALSQGAISVARNSPEVASPFWTSVIRTRSIRTY